MPEFEPIVGRYLPVSFDAFDYRIYVEQAGRGVPLLCLHTAGADSRQYRHLLNDAAVTHQFQVVAFDFPWHGRSNPPAEWWLTRYRLTTKTYLGIVRMVWQALGIERPVVMGCSMGGAIVLKLAAEHQDELRGIIGLESSAYAPGRYNDFLHHPAIHGGELCASYTYGLCSPFSPEQNRRENWWYYRQSGPGIYQGDVHFYSNDWDARADLRRIDTRRCYVALLTGEYLFVYTGDVGSGCQQNSRGKPDDHARHGPFPDDRELSRIPTLSITRARADAGTSIDVARPVLPCRIAIVKSPRCLAHGYLTIVLTDRRG